MHGASKNKIYDSELFIKKKWKINQLTPKEQRKFFFMNLEPPPKKNLVFFFKKFSLYYSIKAYIYTN
jgi:hypothetical protein